MDEMSLSGISSVRGGQTEHTDPIRHQDHGGSNAALALALLRALPDSVYLMNPDGRVTFVNRVAAANLKAGGQGRGAGTQAVPSGATPTAGQAQGRFWWELWPDTAEAELRAMLAAALDGELGEFDAACPGPEGVAQGCTVTLAPIEDLGGAIAKVVCIARAA